MSVFLWKPLGTFADEIIVKLIYSTWNLIKNSPLDFKNGNTINTQMSCWNLCNLGGNTSYEQSVNWTQEFLLGSQWNFLLMNPWGTVLGEKHQTDRASGKISFAAFFYHPDHPAYVHLHSTEQTVHFCFWKKNLKKNYLKIEVISNTFSSNLSDYLGSK